MVTTTQETRFFPSAPVAIWTRSARARRLERVLDDGEKGVAQIVGVSPDGRHGLGDESDVLGSGLVAFPRTRLGGDLADESR